VILLHDKFSKFFSKWSLLVKHDRDILVLTMKASSLLDSALVYTICMMYPFRINGPFMVKNTMNIEFMHESLLSIVDVTPEIEQENIEFCFSRSLNTNNRKRASDTSNTPYLPSTAAGTPLSTDSISSHETPSNNRDLENMRKQLANAILLSNNTRIHVEHVNSGLDATGSWATFQLSDCEKLNLDFIGSFNLAIDDQGVKVSTLILISPSLRVSCLCFTWYPPLPHFIHPNLGWGHQLANIFPCMLKEEGEGFDAL